MAQERRGQKGTVPFSLTRKLGQSPRRGFTLVEVLLVLAILVIIAAVAWPALRRPFAVRRLHAAADEVCVEWYQARVEAMETGRTYVFRYQIGGDGFRTEPEIAVISATFAGGVQSDAEESLAQAQDISSPSSDKTLPESIKFVGSEASGDGLSSLPTVAGAESADAAADCWSEPIYFYPDGTTSDVRLVLAGQQNCAVCLILRGLTGTVSVADLDPIVE